MTEHRGLPKVAVIGGGTGLSVMLRGLKEKPVDITAIVTVADDGGSSGILRTELQMPPPGDVRNVLIALADTEPLLEQLLQYRFSNGNGLAGHSLGNLILAAMHDIMGDFTTGIKALSRVLAVRGRVLPSARSAVVLKAEMEDGTVVTGESLIPKTGKRIKRVFLGGAGVVEPLEEALDAVREAETVVVGPGSLYTSIIPNLIIPGFAEALRNSKATKIYICNVMTQPGETDGYSAADHVAAIERHVGPDLFHHVIVNNGDIPDSILKKYAEQGAAPVRPDAPRLEAMGCKVVADNLVLYQTYLRHHADRLSDHIERLTSAGRLQRGSWTAPDSGTAIGE